MYFPFTKDLAIISSDQPNIENGKFSFKIAEACIIAKMLACSLAFLSGTVIVTTGCSCQNIYVQLRQVSEFPEHQALESNGIKISLHCGIASYHYFCI